MKLRLRGESIRLRLTKSEVASLHGRGSWQETVSVAADGQVTFAYRIQATDGSVPDVTFSSDGSTTTLTARVPRDRIADWAAGNQVGIYFDTAWGTKVAIEKDFRCLDERRDEDETDNFDNPNAGTSAHGECTVGE